MECLQLFIQLHSSSVEISKCSSKVVYCSCPNCSMTSQSRKGCNSNARLISVKILMAMATICSLNGSLRVPAGKTQTHQEFKKINLLDWKYFESKPLTLYRPEPKPAPFHPYTYSNRQEFCNIAYSFRERHVKLSVICILEITYPDG